MTKEIALSWHRMLLGFRSVATSKVSFFVQLCCILVSNGVIAVFWLTFLAGEVSLGGYNTNDVLALSSIVSTSLGVSCCVFGNIRNLSETFTRGDLELLSIYPRSVLLASLGHSVSMVGLGDLLYGLILLCSLHLSLWQNVLFFSCVLTSSLFFVSTFLIFHSLSLFAGRESVLSYSLAEAQITMALFPESIFPIGLRLIFFTFMPVQFIAFFPREIFLHKRTELLWICGSASIIYLFLAVFFFQRGLRHRQRHGI